MKNYPHKSGLKKYRVWDKPRDEAGQMKFLKQYNRATKRDYSDWEIFDRDHHIYSYGSDKLAVRKRRTLQGIDLPTSPHYTEVEGSPKWKGYRQHFGISTEEPGTVSKTFWERVKARFGL